MNGKVVRSPNLWVDPRADKILVDGETLRRKEFEYLAMNKPAGFVTTRADERGRRTVYELLRGDSRWLFPIGRLDKDTSGLLLFTNDTRFGEAVTNPLSKLPKTYRVIVDRTLELKDKIRMESPFRLNERTELKPAKVSVAPNDPARFEITIIEGKNRQIRKVCDRFGYRIISLCRVSIGPISLGELKEGNVRALTEKERGSIVPLVMG